MSNSIDFLGFANFPLGNAVLSEKDSTLIVSNLVENTDGVSILTNGSNDWEIDIEPVVLTQDSVIGSTFNIIDGLQRLKTVGQWAISPTEDGQNLQMLINSKLEGDEITLVAYKDGVIVYQETFRKSDDPTINWIVVAIFILAVAAVIMSNIDYTTEVVRDSNGKVIKTTTTKSFGGGGTINPSTAKANSKTSTGDYIEFDHLYISSSFEYPDGLPEGLFGPISQVNITASDINSITITGERNRN